MHRSHLSSTVRIFLTWVMVSFVLLGADRYGMLGFFRAGVERVVVPLELGFYRAGDLLQEPFRVFRFWRSGASRIADLERQVAELTVDAAHVQQLEEENKAMRALLDSPNRRSWSLVPAPLVGRGGEVSLAVGAAEGVQVGDSVISSDILLGSVEEVTRHQSKVLLLTDPRTHVSVYTPRTGAEGLITGRFGTQVVVTQVLQQEDIREGDLLMTSGSFGAPRGLLIGSISRILSDTTDVYKEALVKPAVDLAHLTTVFVIRSD